MRMRLNLFLILVVSGIFFTMFLTTGCGDDQSSQTVALEAQNSRFEVIIPAFGELEAVQSTPIAVSPKTRGRQTIAWMAQENAMVEKGETIIRFDEAKYKEMIENEEFEINKLNLEITKKEEELGKEKNQLQGEIDITTIERQMAELYGAKDKTIYSLNEIIDAAIDLGYLKKKEDYYARKKKQLEQKSLTELQLLQLKKRTHQMKLNQYKEALQALEIKAPHDGLLVYQSNWRGEKPTLGMNVWAGMKLGKLPDLSNMKAKVFVLESEASGLKKDLKVSITLNSSPGRLFHGKITNIDTIAKPVDQGSPLKYFEIQVGIDRTNQEIMKPGSQVKASIFVYQKENVISVPNQALFVEKEKSYLHVKKGSTIEKRAVEIGRRSLTRTVIKKGLTEGEKVLLGNTIHEEESS